MQEVEAKNLLKKHWGVNAKLLSLPSERDINFKVCADKNYVLKVYPKVDAALKTKLNLQNKVLKFLEGDGLTSCPMVVSTKTQKLLVNPSKNSAARLLSFYEGLAWGDRAEHSSEEIERLGRLIATVDKSLLNLKVSSVEKKSLNAPFIWNMLQAGQILKWSEKITDSKLRELVEETLKSFHQNSLPKLKKMPMQVIHNDGNDYNIIEKDERLFLIDFGDMIYAPKIVGAAVAAAYVGLKSDDPVKQISQFVRGYHSVNSINLEELEIFIELVKVRLASSVANAALQKAQNPGNNYLTISQNDVPKCLAVLDQFDNNFAHYRLRNAIGLEANPNAKLIRDYLLSSTPANLLEKPFSQLKRVYINWSFDNPEIARSTKAIEELMAKSGAEVSIGYYCENRNVYQGEAFNPASESARTFHLGVDIGMPAGTPVYAPLDGVIELFNNNSTYLDYGPVVILRHKTDQGIPFWTLYGHLSIDSISDWKIGKEIKAGDLIGRMGKEEENVGWPPHTHFQLLTDLCGMGIDIYGVAPRDEISLWRGISLNPNLILGIESGTDAHAKLSPSSIRSDRRVVISQNLSLNFKNPINILSGSGAYLFDERGKSYLDLVNNVAHVGHGHPRVVAAAAAQMSELNTNTRYLHQTVVEYGKAITSSMPDPLSVIFFVNSGSEANDLAIRLARAHTNAKGVVAIRHGYHGHTQSVVEISPYKFLGKGGAGAPKHVGVAELPDLFRGKFTGKGATEKYLSNLKKSITSLIQPLSAFFVESIVSTAGQIVLPPGYLTQAFKLVRANGGVCVSDEVQIGMGRVGDKFWGFELHGVVPDIVTLGKPLGNGHPLAAVVTTPQIAASFNNGMEYFNTFGGNPVSAAVGQAVLEVIYDQKLQLNAKVIGDYLQDGVRQLAKSYSIIADVRGSGLFIGVEMMQDEKRPATKEVSDLMEFALTKGVLLSCDGPDNNVLKIKPPLVITKSDVDLLVNVMSDWLGKR
ncbi:MAG: aminotransferase class III-fold pyridoxal phosphate-dependent enzyme [Candidatus Nanopelagicus sp.]